MAARKNKGTKDIPWPDATRERIRTSMLVNRLLSHALGDNEMTDSQIKAASKLIDKVLPNLSSTELSGHLGISHEEALKELE